MTKQIFILDSGIWDGLTVEEVQKTADAMREGNIYRLPYDKDVFVRINMRQFLCALDPTSYSNPKVTGYDAAVMWEIQVDGPSETAEWAEILPRGRISKGGLDDLPAAAMVTSLDAAMGELFTEGKGDFANRSGSEQEKKAIAFHQARLEAERKKTDLRVPYRATDQFPISPEMRNEIIGALRDALVVTLRSRGIHKSVKGPSKLKKLLGKPQNDEVVTTISLSRPASESEYKGGTHASPRMHLRCGHWTHQRHGVGRQLVKPLFIDPIWVNAEADFMTTRTAYRIRP
jgi:hypothetical protein